MKDLLYLKDDQIKEFIQLLYYAYRETFSDPKEILSKKFFGAAHLRAIHLIERNPGINLGELIFKLKVTKQSLNRVLRDLIDSKMIKQIQDDKPAAEIAKDPLNWLGLATMSTLTKVGGVTGSGTANSILRLGMNPGLIRGISRFAGLPGLALSTGFTAYDQYKKYKNEEGLIYNLFNDSSKPIE